MARIAERHARLPDGDHSRWLPFHAATGPRSRGSLDDSHELSAPGDVPHLGR